MTPSEPRRTDAGRGRESDPSAERRCAEFFADHPCHLPQRKARRLGGVGRRRASGSAGQAGLLAAGSSYRPRLPGPSSGICGVRPPFTVAGQRGNYTPFPFHPPVAEPNRNNRPFSYGDHLHLSSAGKLTTRAHLWRRHRFLHRRCDAWRDWYGFLWRLCRDTFQKNVWISATECSTRNSVDTILVANQCAREP